jgi:hypothetical protein
LQKIGFALFLVIFITGCLAIKNQDVKSSLVSNDLEEKILLKRVEKQNITNESYIIQKAIVEIITPEETKKVLVNIKFEKPDKYLFSIKSRTGIEVSRIFISADTILVNDRINKKLYYGSSSYIKVKYGFSISVLPVILGDYIEGKILEGGIGNCSYGKRNIVCTINGININYIIDCRKGKAISVTNDNGIYDNGIKIQFKDFKKEGMTVFPGSIFIDDFKGNSKINIKILKFESQWNGKIDFVPGDKYEISKLQ